MYFGVLGLGNENSNSAPSFSARSFLETPQGRGRPRLRVMWSSYNWVLQNITHKQSSPCKFKVIIIILIISWWWLFFFLCFFFFFFFCFCLLCASSAFLLAPSVVESSIAVKEAVGNRGFCLVLISCLFSRVLDTIVTYSSTTIARLNFVGGSEQPRWERLCVCVDAR